MPTRRWTAQASLPALVAVALALSGTMISGCGSMVSSKEELQRVSADEGIVVGSFLINVEKGEENESGWAFLKGQKAAAATYTVLMSERSLNPFATKYNIRVTPGQEEFFVKKLRAGDYEIKKIQKEGFSSLELNLKATFTVVPGQTSYIGRLEVTFPDRIMVATRTFTAIVDAQQEAIAALKDKREDLGSSVVKSLMVVRP